MDDDDDLDQMVSIQLPSIIREHLDDWNDISTEVAMQIKKELVRLLPVLSPAETLRMLICKDPDSEGPVDNELSYVIEIANRPLRAVYITETKDEIWGIKKNLTFNPQRSLPRPSRNEPFDIDDLYGFEDAISEIPHLVISTNHSGLDDKSLFILVKLCQIYRVKTLEIRANTPRSTYYNWPMDLFGIRVAPREIPFASGLCRIITIDNICFNNFMLKHTGVRVIDIIHRNRWGYSSYNPAIHAMQCLRHLDLRALRHNFYLRAFNNVDVNRQKVIISTSMKEERALHNITKRNEGIFLEKYEATLILLGISRHRKLAAGLCPDIMRVIAKTVFYTHPLAAHIIQTKSTNEESKKK